MKKKVDYKMKINRKQTMEQVENHSGQCNILFSIMAKECFETDIQKFQCRIVFWLFLKDKHKRTRERDWLF